MMLVSISGTHIYDLTLLHHFQLSLELSGTGKGGVALPDWRSEFDSDVIII
jgi:hypothetical protein